MTAQSSLGDLRTLSAIRSKVLVNLRTLSAIKRLYLKENDRVRPARLPCRQPLGTPVSAVTEEEEGGSRASASTNNLIPNEASERPEETASANASSTNASELPPPLAGQKRHRPAANTRYTSAAPAGDPSRPSAPTLGTRTGAGTRLPTSFPVRILGPRGGRTRRTSAERRPEETPPPDTKANLGAPAAATYLPLPAAGPNLPGKRGARTPRREELPRGPAVPQGARPLPRPARPRG